MVIHHQATHHYREKISYIVATIIILALFIASIYFIAGLLLTTKQANNSKYLQPVPSQSAPVVTP